MATKPTEKGIRYRIDRKVKDWLASIDDEGVRELAARNVIVTGGCIVSMFLDERVRDYDIYFRNIETAEAVAKYYVDKFNGEAQSQVAKEHVNSSLKPFVSVADGRVRITIKSAGIAGDATVEEDYDYFESAPEENMERFVNEVAEVLNEADKEKVIEDKDEKKPKYRPIFLSDNAITLSDGIQLVIRFYGEPDKIHENYDYIHCTCYWTPKEGLVCSPEALKAILTKELIYSGSLYPICAMIRVRKFVARGWRINAGQFVKIASQINDLDLTSIAVWEDQLTGVDTAYFRQLIDILKNHAEDGKIEKSYVITLIDRMF